ncbi:MULTISPECIES: hypothetical protein [unclassified Actinomyces]|uniref:Abc-2 type transporter n=2 Tax=Actinomyces glycerinitolerans TaxID=1892869 RepID=A0A1M4RWN6_9ACTO|nr:MULTISPECIES: hypothetical protein [unclassified Actinomyces]RAX21196.1 hypothetical protein DRB07_11735 [Actinomyces sp. Z3]RAX22053.1 hypothetical protein DRB06_04835 [Actinomyces sp. Z5]SHE24107.1 Hypothetical protein ACGLYG10_0305 [Actinomyces glycerinitolerans]
MAGTESGAPNNIRTAATIRALARMAPLDLRRLARDELLSWMAVLPLAVAPVLRLAAPGLVGALSHLGLDAGSWLEPLGAVAFAVITPVLIGTVVGFMLLADKEDGTWRAVAVTPVSLRGYLVWRAGLAVGLAGPLALLGLRVGGLNDLGWGAGAGLALAGAPLAGATAMAIAVFTDSTIQAVTAIKLGFVLLVLPAFVMGRGGPWSLLTAVVPSWWPLRAHAAILDGQIWQPWAAGAVAISAALAAACLCRTACADAG